MTAVPEVQTAAVSELADESVEQAPYITSEPRPLTILAICDNPLLTTGFASVSRPMLTAFADRGWNVHCLGVTGTREDFFGDLNFSLHPINRLDAAQMGFDRIHDLVTTIQPDVVWILIDAGNLARYMFAEQGLMRILDDIEDGEYDRVKLKPFKIVAHVPIEGRPLESHMINAMKKVERNGRLVLYTEGSVESVRSQWPTCPSRWVHHGLDHANFTPYSHEDRQLLKDLLGAKERFLVGVFGANKRTKGYADAVQVAVCLSEMGYGPDQIIFYFHTEWLHPTAQGHHPYDDAKYHGVNNMIVFKPDTNIDNRRDIWAGCDYSGSTIEMAREFGYPPVDGFYHRTDEWSNDVNLTILADCDYISRMNLLDLYFDPSQVEGWGLPQCEAMACGVPVLSVKDHHVRDEIFGQYVHQIDHLPHRLWDTWHVGARLVKFDPQVAAEKIAELMNDRDLLQTHVQSALERARSFKWEDSAKKMIQIVEELVDV